MMKLHHTTSIANAILILRTRTLKGNPFVSFSEVPYIGDIKHNEVTLVFDQDQIPEIMKVTYNRSWFNKFQEHASYIAGEGWQEQYQQPEECFDEEGFEDQDCLDDDYAEAEFQSFQHKSREREWVSKEAGDLTFPTEALLQVLIRNKDNQLEDLLSEEGYKATTSTVIASTLQAVAHLLRS